MNRHSCDGRHDGTSVAVSFMQHSCSSGLRAHNQLVAQEWDTVRYQSQHDFVWKYGSSLIDLLDPQPGESILDLGCGSGELTDEISRASSSSSSSSSSTSLSVSGLDADPNMIAKAKSQFPALDFAVDDARSFKLDEPVDAIFSNAALHWVKPAGLAVESISRALKPGGRFVAEFGGKGNVETVASFLDRRLGSDKNPWYFPSIAEYSSLLEKYGLEVTYAKLYDRPTDLKEGEDGLRNWILMFGNPYFVDLASDDLENVLVDAEKELGERLHNGKNWVADYRRIQIVAQKQV